MYSFFMLLTDYIICIEALYYVFLRRPVMLDELNHRRKEKAHVEEFKIRRLEDVIMIGSASMCIRHAVLFNVVVCFYIFIPGLSVINPRVNRRRVLQLIRYLLDVAFYGIALFNYDVTNH